MAVPEIGQNLHELALPTAHARCGKMGTLEKDGSLSFDGKASSWPPFKTALHKFLDKEGCSWVVEGGNAFCVMLPAAAAKAAKSKTASEKGTVSTNVADYAKKDLQVAFANALVSCSVPVGQTGLF